MERFAPYTSLIAAVVHVTHRRAGAIEQFKAELQLTDGSSLYINEVTVGGVLRKYA
jgi:hypothetical protein